MRTMKLLDYNNCRHLIRYSLLGLPDLSTQCNNKQAESKQKEEIREVYKGDIAE